ncbi:hypothetical protein ACFSHT_22410 [Paraburkholderia silviterrae]|uniref:Scaffolding protein n=1 Tax=Paraburkholderia silviterrae TaxID=2528715 RepID=A0A4R5MG67_9BURK|nr:hypothetical protein [Paraburkholderia silviterrae]TDG25866.1 hypothetical protein EYW47_00400 [Paraburkholderia silviterrae]
MSDVNAVAGAGEAGSTGGEGAELTNTEVTGATGADQGGQGAGEGAGASGAAGNEGGEGGGASGAGEGGAGEGAGEGSGAAQPKPEDDVNKRFSKITRERDEAARREREANDNLRRALEALERANGGKKPDAPADKTAPADDIGAEPTPPEFIDPEQYQRDMAEYTRKVTERSVKMQLREAEVRRQTEATEKSNREAAAAHAQAWQGRRTKALEEMPDYAEVAENPAVHVSQTMAIAITSSENGPKLAYHLGQHPEVAERISRMAPALQLMEMGKLEAQITAPKAPAVSKTPPPIKHQAGAGTPQSKSADEMSMEEYAASRQTH